MTFLAATVPFHVLDDGKRALFFLLVGLIVAFVVVRVNTRLSRAGVRFKLRIGSVVTPGGLHIHHAVFGIVGMVVAGILEFALAPSSPIVEILAFAFGAGMALTLDEFAMILHLEDVYWTGEGRASIDAVILGMTFIVLLLTGLLPRSISEMSDYVTVSRWVGFLLISGSAAFVLVSYLKGRLWLGTVGIFVPPLAWFGAVRLARPGSPWARWRYRNSPARLEKARQRDQDYHQGWGRLKHRVWDVIGGAPHLHPASREERPPRGRDAAKPGPEAKPPGSSSGRGASGAGPA